MKMNKQTYTPDEIVAYWYSEPVKKQWFNSTVALDEEIRTKFSELWQDAADGQLEQWNGEPLGALALCIVLDQFPLNMFRGQAISFSTESQAVKTAKKAIAEGLDQELEDDYKVFLYMPLMHSEDLADQDLCVQLFAKTTLTSNLRFAKHHRDIIRRFGRFPHRNTLLGRETTNEELAYLNSKEAFLG